MDYRCLLGLRASNGAYHVGDTAATQPLAPGKTFQLHVFSWHNQSTTYNVTNHMPSLAPNPTPVHFFGLRAAQFDEKAQALGWPKFRGRQVRDWTYNKLVSDPAAMSNLSRNDQEILRQNVLFSTSTVQARQVSSDGTQKLLLTWDNGANAETVMIPDGPRRTACVSSQVGCPVGCKFCASGVNGVKGNLSASQIVEQIFRLNEILLPKKSASTTLSSWAWASHWPTMPT